MYWYLQLAVQLDDAPWPATQEELLDYAESSCLNLKMTTDSITKWLTYGLKSMIGRAASLTTRSINKSIPLRCLSANRNRVYWDYSKNI